ncbi:proline-rich protein 2-like [Cervus elaphus]|uniref:proline-rich protein 2-like n=1 Tax=Cervus elaphus TaxID=9860 RepID=UPI001CC2961C|nr:proline-rich protein 2-like [Cervus elaphus]
MRSGRVCGVRTDRAEPGEVPVTAGPESTKQQGDSHGGPGPGAIRNAIPAGAPGPWPAQRAREPGSRERPKQPGGGEERAGRPPGPGDGPNPPRAGKEDPGAPPAAQRLLCRAKDFRSNGLGPPGRNCTSCPHAATDGAARPPPARLPGPDLGPRPPPRERAGGGPVRGLSPSSVAGPRAQTCGRPGLPRRGPQREAPGLGITEGRGGRSPPPRAPGSDVRAPGPPPQRTPAGSSGAGDHRGAGREESPPPGSGLRRAGPRASPAEDPSGKLRGRGSPRGGAGGVPRAPGSAPTLRHASRGKRVLRGLVWAPVLFSDLGEEAVGSGETLGVE